jgi:hypothetical protein
MSREEARSQSIRKRLPLRQMMRIEVTCTGQQKTRHTVAGF